MPLTHRCVVLLVAAVIAAFPTLSPAQPSDREQIQALGAAKRRASGLWEQAVAIESHLRHGSGGGAFTPSVQASSANEPALAFIPGGRFAVADGAHPIRVFSADTGKLLSSFGEPLADSWERHRITTSSDGRFLVVLPDVEPTIWDTRTGRSVAKLPRFDDYYHFGDFLPDGKSLAVYRGRLARGKVPGNLQIWSIDPAGQRVTLEQSIDADTDARGIDVVGPYLLLQNYRRCQVFDAATRDVVLQQPPSTDEAFLFLDPPGPDGDGRYAAIVYSEEEKGSWSGQIPQIRLVRLPPGGQATEVRRWDLPLDAPADSAERYHVQYAVSPGRKVLAIAQERAVSFYRFEDGQRLCQVSLDNPQSPSPVVFLDDRHALFRQGRLPGSRMSLAEIPTGREVATLPEDDYVPVVSPDGRRALLQREWAVVDPAKGKVAVLPRALIVLWKRTGP